ncbi:hypothetical protein [Paenibacillus thiaminolyticus]|uniref:hypothetical protein n=1 Tax=Paenibacillus thiaminolyticus TaxID=49283 RepID=UPI002542B45D|nr:hypothetical protein [Paenibacillus thiaminolyticus]WII38150.1 hypothetical protein O0V01_03100 [Paenibacillus thiaminolyticus]
MQAVSAATWRAQPRRGRRKASQACRRMQALHGRLAGAMLAAQASGKSRMQPE